MNRKTFILMLAIYTMPLAQTVINLEVPFQGKIQLSDEISIPGINSGYTLWLPDSKPVEGLVVCFHPRRDT